MKDLKDLTDAELLRHLAEAVREDRANVAALAVSRVPSAPTDTTEGDPS
jgi:hypothetical protein